MTLKPLSSRNSKIELLLKISEKNVGSHVQYLDQLST